eukprot:TRINITY_DN1800_c0_g1_i1.p1 TRINITY_DN1800_c0_g1~~TRINITY_DN1800_c0_g1_i1.p1  ORF type:complete len:160 (+),score=33.29 TRINITY_DN1800_c0_g1_i1:47-481(+)
MCIRDRVSTQSTWGLALKNINSLLSKSKTKDKFTPEELQILHLLKGLSHVRTQEYGEAREIFFNYLATIKSFEGDDEVFPWLESMAACLGCYKELREFYQPYAKKKEQDEAAQSLLMNLQIKEKDFKAAQQTCLLYTSPSPRDS